MVARSVRRVLLAGLLMVVAAPLLAAEKPLNVLFVVSDDLCPRLGKPLPRCSEVNFDMVAELFTSLFS